MDENNKNLESSNDSNNFNLINEIQRSNYIDIKSYNVKISDKLFLFKICRPNENKNSQIIFICKEKEGNIKDNIININNIENNKKK